MFFIFVYDLFEFFFFSRMCEVDAKVLFFCLWVFFCLWISRWQHHLLEGCLSPLSRFCTFGRLSLSFRVGLLLGLLFFSSNTSFPGGSDEKSICLQCGRPRFDPWVRKIAWSRKWQPTPVFLPGKSHGWRKLIGDSPSGRKESDMIHFSLSSLSQGDG